MESTTMVPLPAINAGRLATPAATTSNASGGVQHNTTTSRVERLDGQGFSDQATDFTLKSCRTKTNKSYDSLFRRWNRWCAQWGSNPFSGPVSEIANFLASLYQEGYQYNSINAYRSAISSVHEKVDGVATGQHPLITRMLKGVFNYRPPIPRYTDTWDVQKVLNYWETRGESHQIPLKLLSEKTVFLLAVTRPSRSADLFISWPSMLVPLQHPVYLGSGGRDRNAPQNSLDTSGC
jgi:hypothetical protein